MKTTAEYWKDRYERLFYFHEKTCKQHEAEIKTLNKKVCIMYDYCHDKKRIKDIKKHLRGGEK